jgi:XTP/dITP diphosphohydrolase
LGNNGFGYDPILLIPELGKTVAELSMAEKNRVSHRALATLKLKDKLRELAAETTADGSG